MKLWEALVLGIVQGASEFLPISSSGHLLLLEKLGIGTGSINFAGLASANVANQEQNLFFNVMLHVGTLFAVLIAMRKKWVPLLRKPVCKQNGYILLACVPTILLAIVFKLLLPSLVDGKYLGCGFVLTALLLYAGENAVLTKSTLLNVKTSVLTGVFQGVAVLPGISRSGATISALTLQGVQKSEATTFSFLLSIPIIIGSALYESIDLFTGKISISVSPSILVVGMASAFLSGLVSIKLFLKLVEKHSMKGFVLYTLLLGVTVSVVPFFI